VAALNEVNDCLGGSAWQKDFGDTGLFEGGYVSFGDDTTDEDRDIVHAFFVKELHDLRADGVVGA